MFHDHADEDESEAAPVRTAWGLPLAVGLILGLVLGGVGAWLAANKMAAGDEARNKEAFEKQVATTKTETDKIKAEADKMREQLKEQEAAWRKTPDKPSHLKVGQGVLLFWPNEGMMRKYYVYRGKAPAGNLLKVTEDPVDINFIYLNHVDAGSWRFAVSALTKEGVETDKGEPVTLAFPLK
jgi:hypothetical protein